MGDDKVAEIFEHQRFVKGSWDSFGNLLASDPSVWSNAAMSKGSSMLPQAYSAPGGYEWAGDWTVDTNGTNTDGDGWMYVAHATHKFS